MKSQINRLSRTLGIVAGALLLLGCGGRTANASKVEKGVQADSGVVPNALAETSPETKKAALDEEPARKIEPAPFQTSAGVTDVIKLAESGVGEEVILAYIENSPIAYELSVEEILYLNDLGVSVPVIAAMIHHGNVLREKETKVAAQESSMETAVAAVKKALAEGGNAQEETKLQPAPQAPLANPPSAPNELPPLPEYAETPPSYSPPPQPAYENVPAQVNYFYNDLSPYGSWMELPNYGWCWQPSTVIIDRGWRPYCHRGRWLYSDCGWYWHSDYSWGWAPFHYGRWYDHPRCGWVWFPELTWAPAWVSWRYTDTHCGWAPLPPGAFCGRGGLTYFGAWVGIGFDFGLSSLHFNFVSYKDFSHRYPSQHILKGAQAQTVYSQSKVINNIVVGKNNTIINNGVGYERIAGASRSEIRKVAIKDLPPTSEKVLKADRLERTGSSLVVYRAPIAKLAPENASGLAASRGGQELRKDSTTIPSQPPQKRVEERRSLGGLRTEKDPVLFGTKTESIRPSTPRIGSGPNPASAQAPNAAIQADRETVNANGRGTPSSFTEASKSPSRREPLLRSVTTPNSAPKATPGYQTQSSPSPSDQAAITPRLSKPITERGIQSQSSQSAFGAPYGVPQPATTFPSASRPSVPERTSQAAQTPQFQAQQQPQIITPSYRQGMARPAPAVPNYPNYYRPSIPNPNYAAPAPAVRQPVPPQYSAPTIVQPSYRPAPVQQAPAPRIEAPRSGPAYSRPSPPSTPLKRDRER